MNKGVKLLICNRRVRLMTQDELADKIGLKRSTIASIEAGINTPSVATAKLIANELNFDWTLFFEEV